MGMVGYNQGAAAVNAYNDAAKSLSKSFGSLRSLIPTSSSAMPIPGKPINYNISHVLKSYKTITTDAGNCSGNTVKSGLQGLRERVDTSKRIQDQVIYAKTWQPGTGGRWGISHNRRTSWCNQGTFDVIRLKGGNLKNWIGDRNPDNLNGLRTVQAFRDQASRGTIRKISPEEAYQYTNQGFTVVAAGIGVGEDGPWGHVSPVRPDESSSVLTLSNIGLKNDVMPASGKNGAFLNSPVEYYVDPKEFN